MSTLLLSVLTLSGVEINDGKVDYPVPRKRECEWCRGDGYIVQGDFVVCPACNGAGYVPWYTGRRDQ